MLGMSGGVDSSSAAVLLKNAGFEVVGVGLILHDIEGANSLDDAESVCRKLGIRFLAMDYSREFKRDVIDYFADEYISGRTPNPCVVCNKVIKWRKLLELADAEDAGFVATGHYARVISNGADGGYELRKGIDKTKDQSYALWGLDREKLARTILPVGEMVKKDAYRLLKDNDISLSRGRESQDICFIPCNDLPGFLEEISMKKGLDVRPGPILDPDGKVMGEHKGLFYYTIGQRKGLGISHPVPLYVKALRMADNAVVVCEDEELKSIKFTATRINWLIDPPRIGETLDFDVKIRYRHSPSPARVTLDSPDSVSLEFRQGQRAITPGQSAVFYRDDRVCGGGVIHSVE